MPGLPVHCDAVVYSAAAPAHARGVCAAAVPAAVFAGGAGRGPGMACLGPGQAQDGLGLASSFCSLSVELCSAVVRGEGQMV